MNDDKKKKNENPEFILMDNWNTIKTNIYNIMCHFDEVQRKRAQNKKFEWHPRVQKQLADVLAKLEEEEESDSRSVKDVDGFLTIPQIIKNINQKNHENL